MSDDPRAVRPHRARRGEGDRLRTEVLDAAEDLLIDLGSVDAVSMRAIAARVGVTPPAIYLHFEDKDRLFFAVCERRFEVFATALLGALATPTTTASPLERLRALADGYITWGLEHPEHYRVLFGPSPIPADVDPGDIQGRQVFDTLVELIVEGEGTGVFDVADAVTAALFVWAAVHGYVELAITTQGAVPDVDIQSRRTAVLDHLTRSIAAPRSASD